MYQLSSMNKLQKRLQKDPDDDQLLAEKLEEARKERDQRTYEEVRFILSLEAKERRVRELEKLQAYFANNNFFQSEKTKQTVETMHNLYRHIKFEEMVAGETVFHFGEPGSLFYVIISGEVDVKTPASVELEKESATPEGLLSFIITYYEDIDWRKLRPTDSDDLKTILDNELKRLGVELQFQFYKDDAKGKQGYGHLTNKKDLLKQLDKLIDTNDTFIHRDLFKILNPNKRPTVTMHWFRTVAKIPRGGAFGERALMNNENRAATIMCSQDCSFATMHRKDYNWIIRTAHKRSMRAKVEFFKSFRLFSSLRVNVIEKIQYYMVPRTFIRGQTIYFQGQDSIDGVYFIESGEFEVSQTPGKMMKYPEKRLSVSIEKREAKKQKIVLYLLGNLEIFGFEEIIENSERRKTAVLCHSTTAKAWFIPADHFIDCVNLYRFSDKVLQEQITKHQYYLQRMEQTKVFKEKLEEKLRKLPLPEPKEEIQTLKPQTCLPARSMSAQKTTPQVSSPITQFISFEKSLESPKIQQFRKDLASSSPEVQWKLLASKKKQFENIKFHNVLLKTPGQPEHDSQGKRIDMAAVLLKDKLKNCESPLKAKRTDTQTLNSSKSQFLKKVTTEVKEAKLIPSSYKLDLDTKRKFQLDELRDFNPESYVGNMNCFCGSPKPATVRQTKNSVASDHFLKGNSTTVASFQDLNSVYDHPHPLVIVDQSASVPHFGLKRQKSSTAKMRHQKSSEQLRSHANSLRCANKLTKFSDVDLKAIGLKLLDQNNAEDPIDYEFLFKMVLVGDSKVGKTSLVSRFEQNEFPASYQKTIGTQSRIKFFKSGNKWAKLQLWDRGATMTEHQPSFHSDLLRTAHCVMFVYDVTNRNSFYAINYWLEQIPITSSVIKVLVANKSDKKAKVVSTEEGMRFAKIHGMSWFTVSAQKGSNCQMLLECCVEEVRKRVEALNAGQEVANPPRYFEEYPLKMRTSRRVRQMSADPKNLFILKPKDMHMFSDARNSSSTIKTPSRPLSMTANFDLKNTEKAMSTKLKRKLQRDFSKFQANLANTSSQLERKAYLLDYEGFQVSTRQQLIDSITMQKLSDLKQFNPLEQPLQSTMLAKSKSQSMLLTKKFYRHVIPVVKK